VTLTAKGLDCTRPALVKGLYVGRPFEERVEPTCTDRARPLEVLWALSQISELDQQNNPGAATALAVEYAILTSHTSLLGLDSDIHNPLGAAVATTTPVTLTEDFLQRVPAGRTYQSAVQSLPGTSGEEISIVGAVGGNPNMGGSSSNENTYMLDGGNV